jgi:phage FluMu protein Com
MFCEKEGFQALCKDKCHQAKSIQEKKIGAERRAREKKSAKKKRKI